MSKIKHISAVILAGIVALTVLGGATFYLTYLICNTEHLDGIINFISKLV